MKNKLRKTNNGITLIALVITIIVLLILAGVTIATLTGDNGILTKANESKIEQTHGAVREGMTLEYNEYQIEINTANNGELASTKKVRIQGKEEKVLSTTNKTFLQFLNDKGYIKEGTTNILNVETLTGNKQALGNGTDTDIYKLEENIVNYYDKNNKKEEIWNVNDKNNSMGRLELEADTGKEGLILVYEVKEGESAKLPFCLQWRDWYGNDETVYDAMYDFHVDWGDGVEANITNENIESLSVHEFNKSGTYEVKITGSYDILGEGSHINNLIKVKQWGTTGLKIVDFKFMDELTEIVSPTENSFKELKHITFGYSGLSSIPENLLARCPELTSLDGIFDSTNITSIPENIFLNCDKVTNFSSVFSQNDIREIPENLFKKCSDATNVSYAFSETSITTIPENLFDNCPQITNFTNTFAKDRLLTSIPECLFANCSNAERFYGTFRETGITRIPENLFKDCQKVESFSRCFMDCYDLQGKASELWLRVPNGEECDYIGVPDGLHCFASCQNLSNFEQIPDYWTCGVEPE